MGAMHRDLLARTAKLGGGVDNNKPFKNLNLGMNLGPLWNLDGSAPHKSGISSLS